ncbi:hypothetical protein HZP35_14170 [Elizabethkingia anophelis]|uniref:Uncharacterized protein n=1 Tax=Elizabethkingia miricola TaxID=172045 RepID=A0ABD5B374_ELIMR|nr:hypothetical protein [Elizabethkingia miricola]MCT4156083.1 hypothetical protein [Elizabethkingia anophelis]MCT4170277.1 hypothetical protein [Elizabethkingia anophelis]MCT4244823.1 hypothetical protein [Elizabethkingia anophelis]MCT4248427.1 hypothetical protein [Elizabethkingia anophelis]MCT4259417.1 hypothetical protein [Elizabethkingia anophelis]
MITRKTDLEILIEGSNIEKINEMIDHKEKCLIEALDTNDIGRVQLLERQIKKLKSVKY